MSSLAGSADAAVRLSSVARLPRRTLAGFLIAVVAVVVIGFFAHRAQQVTLETSDRVRHAFDTAEALQRVLSGVKDAETGQRGFLLTGQEAYLEPFNSAKAAMAGILDQARPLLSSDPRQAARFERLSQTVADKLAELEQTIALRRAGNAEGAIDVVRTDRGKAAMDRIRNLVAEAQGEERELLATRLADLRDALQMAGWVARGGSLVLLVLIVLAALVASRDHVARETELWIRAGQMALSEKLQGEQRIEVLGDRVLAFLAERLDAQIGAMYAADGAGGFDRFARYALDADAAPASFRSGAGLLGQAAREARLLQVADVPADYMAVNSSLGRARPRELLISPAEADGAVQAVVELGLFRHATDAERELLRRACSVLGVAVRSATDRSRLEQLLNETRLQAERLQTQQEELRVSNEELEEQSAALRSSQAELEAQQAELEQINSQLEGQTRLLEDQRDRLAESRELMARKASELERASAYKSEFLANMSHELRTPLNSTLILAKLLADNKAGNLNAQQVKFAQTISAAGQELLALINEILDLSKIEAGQVDLEFDPVPLRPLVESLSALFEPMAEQRGLQWVARVDADAAPSITSDDLRLRQILKNLLSNALKFTSQGSVSLTVTPAAAGGVSFVVEDTGIGIEPAHRELVFEAFRQADGSTHRKYGGTGLGLTISRDLARLLGGDILLDSTPGVGSRFTLTLPAQPPALREPAQPVSALAVTVHATPAAPESLQKSMVDDDRQHLVPSRRTLLVIEDDTRFADILRDLAHETGFQCVIAQTASDGLAAARTYRPSAIVLDMNLPDHSGLGVLDQLKRDPDTRHIPVHVASVADFTREALELGAIGYVLKPVKHDEIVEALRRLEAKFSQGLRRVLVVEDDERQRSSIGELLGGDNVQIVGAARAAEALDEMRKSPFDCIVLDLSLPDMSGYELLERIAAQPDGTVPPVIVYTGRSLTVDEEQRLRKFSKSIILKDARSPERLLDEVTLFLHQVESTLPAGQQRMLQLARSRDASLKGRRILVVEDDVRNVYALSSVLEPTGAAVEIARNGQEALDALARSAQPSGRRIDLVLMDIMMPVMDGLTATREIRRQPQWRRLPIIALTAKAMKDDHDNCLAAGANDYIAKPLNVEKLLSLVRVWMPK